MSKIAPAAKEEVRSTSLFEKCHRYEVAERVRNAGVYSFFRVIESAQDPEVVCDGRRMIMLGSNNYLGLTNDPRVKEAAIDAIRKYGSGCAGSRFLNGTLDCKSASRSVRPVHEKEAAVTFATGYRSIWAHLCWSGGRRDLPRQAGPPPASSRRSALLRRVRKFKHNDARDLARQMRNTAAAAG